MDDLWHVGGEVAALLVDAAALALCLKHFLKWKSTLGKLERATTYDLDAREPPDLNGSPSYAVVRGVVRPLGDPLRSDSGDSTGVIRKLTVKEHVTARTAAGFWSDESRTVYETFNAVPFVVAGRASRVEIVDVLDANMLDLDVVADRFEPLTPSVLDHIWGYFSGVRQRGLQTTEEMLRDGTFVTAIGELTGAAGETPKLQPPRDGAPLFLISSTRSSLVKKIKESQTLLKTLAFVFGTVAIVLTGRIAYKYIKRRRKLLEETLLKQKLADSRKERRTLGREKNLPEAQLCVVCTDNPKEIILLPCGHVSLCEDCSENVKDRCPVCRTEIESRAPAFIV